MSDLIFNGRVVKGKQRGAHLGFPTINIGIRVEDDFSDWGIFVSEITADGTTYQGVTHLGPVPTFSDEVPTCETFVFNMNDDWYGKQVRKRLLKKIRDIKKFESTQALREQIEKDISVAREYFNHESHQ